MDVTPDDTRLWLLLTQWPGLPRRALRQLLTQAATPAELLNLDDSICRAAGASADWLYARRQYGERGDSAADDRAAAQAECLRTLGASLITLRDERYPALLAEIPDPPALLYARGDSSLMALPQLAVVGSRNASRGGLEAAAGFASELARRGLCITSGLAHGVDAASHRGALAVQGKTVAVLGTGLDVIYPRRNAPLYEQIAEQGLLLSEFPPGTPPRAEQFPQRNRLISGLSLGVLVVEAAVRSGSLITARLALEQGREVFAMPGSIHNPLARGCHRLLREGACLVESVEDILDAWVGWLPPALSELAESQLGEAPAREDALDPGQQALLAQLGFEPLPLPRIAELTRLAVADLLPRLTLLELDGWVEQQGPCWVRCR